MVTDNEVNCMCYCTSWDSTYILIYKYNLKNCAWLFNTCNVRIDIIFLCYFFVVGSVMIDFIWLHLLFCTLHRKLISKLFQVLICMPVMILVWLSPVCDWAQPLDGFYGLLWYGLNACGFQSKMSRACIRFSLVSEWWCRSCITPQSSTLAWHEMDYSFLKGIMQLKASQKAVGRIEVTAKGKILCFWPNVLVPTGIAHKNARIVAGFFGQLLFMGCVRW